MVFRLNEGEGVAYYQIGVLDSGQVTGLKDEEVLETLLLIFYMSTTLKPQAKLSIHKVRKSFSGYSCMIKVEKKEVSSNKIGECKAIVLEWETNYGPLIPFSSTWYPYPTISVLVNFRG